MLVKGSFWEGVDWFNPWVATFLNVTETKNYPDANFARTGSNIDRRYDNIFFIFDNNAGITLTFCSGDLHWIKYNRIQLYRIKLEEYVSMDYQ